jgi:tetratricopeptide (TPR) repeat protein
MLNLAELHQNVIAQSRALQGLAASRSHQGDHRAALESAIRAEALAREANAPPELIKALWTQGFARYRLGESRAALSLGEQALELARETKNLNEMGRNVNLLGAAHYVLGEYAQAQNYWENALKIFQQLGNRQQGMVLLSNLGVIADARGDYEKAFHRYHSALEIAREIGNKDGEIYILSNRGIELVALKNYAAAEADLRQVIRLTGINGSWFLPNTYNYYAEALLGLERNEEAAFAAYQGLVQSLEYNSLESIGGAWRVLGLVGAKTGKPVRLKDRQTGQWIDYDARACFTRSEKIFSDAEINGEWARTLREWAKYELEEGNTQAARRMWQRAREIFEKLGADLEVQRMDQVLAP